MTDAPAISDDQALATAFRIVDALLARTTTREQAKARLAAVIAGRIVPEERPDDDTLWRMYLDAGADHRAIRKVVDPLTKGDPRKRESLKRHMRRLRALDKKRTRPLPLPSDG